MDQPIDVTRAETVDEIMDAVTRDGVPRYIDRDGKEPVVVISLAFYWNLKLGPAPEWLDDSWRRAREAGLDQMTTEQIDAYRREKAQADAEQ